MEGTVRLADQLTGPSKVIAWARHLLCPPGPLATAHFPACCNLSIATTRQFSTAVHCIGRRKDVVNVISMHHDRQFDELPKCVLRQRVHDVLGYQKLSFRVAAGRGDREVIMLLRQPEAATTTLLADSPQPTYFDFSALSYRRFDSMNHVSSPLRTLIPSRWRRAKPQHLAGRPECFPWPRPFVRRPPVPPPSC